MKTYRFITALVTAPALFVPLVAAHVPDDCRVIDARDPDDHEDDVVVCRVDTWFHAPETDEPVARFGNAGALVEELPTWSTDAPAAAPDGGAGYVGLNILHNLPPQAGTKFHPAGGPTFEGTFTGPIDNLAVTLHFVSPNRQALQTLLPDFDTVLQLTIDGNPYFETTGGNGTKVTVDAATGEVPTVRFAFIGVYPTMLAQGADIDADAEHTIRLHIAPLRTGDETMFVYDTAEVPSGMVFNIEPPSLSDFTPLETS
ncbi:MAG: hypothetical protein KY469_15940 [Actinobacteria bacterium]|nr:hypothetical protein [Actinomycetota bacterium]